MNWISVKEKRPPQNVYVLVTKLDGRKYVEMYFIQIAKRLGNQWFADYNEEEIYHKEGIITHWMPLPDPPELP